MNARSISQHAMSDATISKRHFSFELSRNLSDASYARTAHAHAIRMTHAVKGEPVIIHVKYANGRNEHATGVCAGFETDAGRVLRARIIPFAAVGAPGFSFRLYKGECDVIAWDITEDEARVHAGESFVLEFQSLSEAERDSATRAGAALAASLRIRRRAKPSVQEGGAPTGGCCFFRLFR